MKTIGTTKTTIGDDLDDDWDDEANSRTTFPFSGATT